MSWRALLIREKLTPQLRGVSQGHASHNPFVKRHDRRRQEVRKSGFVINQL